MIAGLFIITGIAVHLYVERPLLNFLRQRWTSRARIPDGLRIPEAASGSPLVWMARLFLTISLRSIGQIVSTLRMSAFGSKADLALMQEWEPHIPNCRCPVGGQMGPVLQR